MELHETFDVTEAQESLLGEGMVSSLLEVHGAQFNLRRVLRLIKVLADFHDLVQVVLLTVDFNRLFVSSGLDVEISSLLPIA